MTLLAAAAVGALARFAAGDLPMARLAGAFLCVCLAAAICLGALASSGEEAWRRVPVLIDVCGAGSFMLFTVADAGRGAVGAAAVVFSTALLAFAAAVAARRFASPGGAAALGAAVPVALTGLLFVADPLVEWNGAAAASQTVANWVVRVNPLAAGCSLSGGLGVDWLRMPLLYDGPGMGGGGLSVIGQYYQGTPYPSPYLWSLVVLAVSGCLFALRPRRE